MVKVENNEEGDLNRGVNISYTRATIKNQKTTPVLPT